MYEQCLGFVVQDTGFCAVFLVLAIHIDCGQGRWPIHIFRIGKGGRQRHRRQLDVTEGILGDRCHPFRDHDFPSQTLTTDIQRFRIGHGICFAPVHGTAEGNVTPLTKRSAIIHIFQAVTAIKCPKAAFCYTFRNRNICQCAAILKRVLADKADTFGDINTADLDAILKSAAANALHTFFNDDILDQRAISPPWTRVCVSGAKSAAIAIHVASTGNRECPVCLQQPGQILSELAAKAAVNHRGGVSFHTLQHQQQKRKCQHDPANLPHTPLPFCSTLVSILSHMP